MILRLVLVTVRIVAFIAPSSRRGTWREQWRADLWHYDRWLERHAGASRLRRAARLCGRAAGCIPHAISLRIHDWSPHTMSHDLKFAWRMLVRRPAFTLVAVLILALGIGANATIFSWVRFVILRPVPGVNSSELIALHGKSPTRDDLSFSYPNFLDVRAARPDGIEDLIAFRGVAMNLRGDGDPRRVWGQLVTANFFDVLRVRPMLGRGFLESEGATRDKEQVAVLSYQGWLRLFNGDVSIVGRTINLNTRPFTVVGVAPADFRGTMVGLTMDVFVPMTMQRAFMSGDRLGQRGNSFLQVYARLSSAAGIERAQASLDLVAARLAQDHPDSNGGRRIVVRPLWQDGAAGLLLPVMATLMAVVGVVLLIACANLAGLLLARAASRQREVAVRLAVGASRGRLVRQLLLESALLAVAGGAAGVVLTIWTAGGLRSLAPPTPFPIAFDARVDMPVIGFSIVVTLLTTLVFGLVPAMRASRPDVNAALKSAAGAVAGTARGRMRSALVVAQVALSLLLLVCAALFLRGLGHARTIDPGFSIRDGALAAVDLLPNGYDAARGSAFHRELLAKVSSLPGVASATMASAMPLDISAGSNMTMQIDGYRGADGEEIDAYYNRIGSGYFDAMGIPIVAGRAIDDRDVDGKPLAIVINETMARKYWAGQDPIGRIVRFGSGPATVVGIARNGKYGQLNETPKNYMYVPLAQYFRHDALLIVRTTGEPGGVVPSLHAEVRKLDPNLPLFDVRTIEEHMKLSVFIPRLASTLLSMFGALALLLAIVGLYSVVAFNVSQRTREIGVRMAMGATRGQILRLVLRHGIVLTGTGLTIGAALALAAAYAVRSQLMGIAPIDAVSFVATTVLLLTVSLLACAVPARRATRLDPVRALRIE